MSAMDLHAYKELWGQFGQGPECSFLLDFNKLPGVTSGPIFRSSRVISFLDSQIEYPCRGAVMRRWVAFLINVAVPIAGFAIPANSQQPAKSSSAQLLVQQQTTAPGWREYSYAEDGFSISAPSKPEFQKEGE